MVISFTQPHSKEESYDQINRKQAIAKGFGEKSLYTGSANKARDKIGVEQNKIEDITNDENEITKILYLMKNNEVTPIGLEDVILEIKNRQAIAKNKKLSYNT